MIADASVDLASAIATNRWPADPWATIALLDNTDAGGAWTALAHLRDPSWTPLWNVRNRRQRARSRIIECARLRVNPNTTIEPAICAYGPLTVEDAALFSANSERARRAETVAQEAAVRLRDIGAPIHACSQEVPPATRRAVWTVRDRDRHSERTTLLLTKLLVEQLDPRPPGLEVLDGRWFAAWFWAQTPITTIAIGTIAWRALCERGASLPARSTKCGAKLYVRDPGRPLAELPNPFESLVELLDLGVELASIGDQAIAIFRTPVP